MVDDLVDRERAEPSYILGERDMLEAWLEFHRRTLELKCAGLSDDDRKRRPVPTSALSLHGLVRHMADVERHWFQRVLLRQPDLRDVFWDDGRDDIDFVPLDDADWDSDLATWHAQCDASREAAAGRVLEDTGVHRGEEVPLRWIYAHMVEEYARHNGHADMLREMVDGAVGW